MMLRIKLGVGVESGAGIRVAPFLFFSLASGMFGPVSFMGFLLYFGVIIFCIISEAF